MKLVACQITMELICHWLPVFGRCFLKGNQGAYSNRQAEAATANFKTKLGKYWETRFYPSDHSRIALTAPAFSRPTH